MDLVHWENLEGAGGEGGGRGDQMGNTCKPMAVSFQCMTKSTTKKKKKCVLHVGTAYVDKSRLTMHVELLFTPTTMG